jgi:hypothetical protein
VIADGASFDKGNSEVSMADGIGPSLCVGGGGEQSLKVVVHTVKNSTALRL